MRNKSLISLGIIGGVIFLLSFGNFVYGNLRKSFKYSTPLESFEKSVSVESELIDIIEMNDIAIVVYKEKGGISTYQVIAQNDGGWDSILHNQKNVKHLMTEYGVIDIIQLHNQYVIAVTMQVLDGKEPSISDNQNSEFTLVTGNSSSDSSIYYGFAILTDIIPDNYAIWIDSTEIAV